MSHELIQMAVDEATRGVESGEGGPFGALIVDEKGEILSLVHNECFKNTDPTAHAEVTAIRRACAKIGAISLEGCVLYSSSYPCPMCLAAAMWAEIKFIYYAASLEECKASGFDDMGRYDAVQNEREGKGHLLGRLCDGGGQHLEPFKKFQVLRPDYFSR